MSAGNGFYNIARDVRATWQSVRMSTRRSPGWPLKRLGLVLVLCVLAPVILHQNASASGPPSTWYKTDTHVHSSVSASAYTDVGLLAQAGTALGYNAIFLSDHAAGSTWPLGIGNLSTHVVFDDVVNGYWNLSRYGSTTSATGALATSPVLSGTNSLHLAVTSNTYGESLAWGNRGPNFRSGNTVLHVSIYPTRVDPGSGLDVSVSIGGDPTVRTAPYGYTPQGGTASPGKSTVLIWQLGSTRAASSNPNARIITYPLAFTLNTWNNYTLDVSSALLDVPVADRPLDYAPITDIKMTAAGNHGTADGYFDSYVLDSSAPVAPADEFVYRNTFVDDYDTSVFRIFPSAELGTFRQSQRFNFSISQPSQWVAYASGNAAILPTQQTGYPSQLNCPGTCTPAQDVLNTQGEGADFMETRLPAFQTVWEGVLQQGVQVLGTWSSDSHANISAGAVATYIYAPTLTLDDLMRSLYEGRTYNALNNFTGRVILNLDPASQEPFSSRYPVYVSNSQASQNVHLAVTGGLVAGDRIKWVVNGTPTITDTVAASTYDAVKAIPFAGARTYVRAEVVSATGSQKAMTQAIFFLALAGLPVGDTYNVDHVNTPDGRAYTKITTKGITGISWLSASQILSLTLTNPAQSLTDMRMTTAVGPGAVRVNGSAAPQLGTLADYLQATGSAWYYDAGAGLLYLQALHAANTARVDVDFSGSQFPTATATVPGVPTNTPTSTVVAATNTPGTPTLTPTVTATATPTNTSAPTSTLAPTSTRTATNTATVTSTASATATPPPGGSVIFSDDFESGGLAQWSQVSALVVQQQEVFGGLYAARGTTTGGAAYALKQLSAPQTDLFFRIRFKIVSQGANWAYLERFRTAGGVPLIGAYVSQSTVGKLGYRNDVTGISTTSTTTVTRGAWHELQVHLHVDTVGGQSQTETWFDGVRLSDLSRTEAIGTTATGKLQLGDTSGGYARDIAYDDVVASTGFVGGTPVPTSTATPVPTTTTAATSTNTATPTLTSTQVPPTSTATVTNTPTSIPGATNTPTFTVTPTPTATDTPTATSSATVTSTSTPTSTSTNTSTPTITLTPTATNTAAAGLLFYDGFESGNFSQWTSVVTSTTSGSRSEVIAGAAYAGTRGAHLTNGVGGRADNGSYCLITITPPASHVLSAQARVKINSISGAGSLRVFQLRDEVRGRTVLRVQYNNGVWQLYLARKDGTTTVTNLASGLSVGTWQLLEATYDWSGAQPVARVYVGGVLQATITDSSAGVALSPNRVFCMVYEDVITVPGDIYFDEVRVANAYIGGTP
ncbi:MAG: hypothetical protein ABI670_04560 [Chloroflexota bacterium]